MTSSPAFSKALDHLLAVLSLGFVA